MSRETWVVTNIGSNQQISLGDLPFVPALASGESQNLLSFHSAEEILDSINLRAAFLAGLLNLTKTLDNVSTTYTGSEASAETTRIDVPTVKTLVAGGGGGNVAVLGQLYGGPGSVCQAFTNDISLYNNFSIAWTTPSDNQSVAGGWFMADAFYPMCCTPFVQLCVTNPANMVFFFTEGTGFVGILDFTLCVGISEILIAGEISLTRLNVANLPQLQALVFADCIADDDAIAGVQIDTLQQIVDIDFSGNQFSSDAVDNLLEQTAAVAETFDIVGGFINVSDQTPSAPPSETSAAAVSYLVSNGWTVTND